MIRFDRKAVRFPVQSDACFFGSFYIVQRDNQRCRLYPSVGSVVVKTNDNVVQVKYTNQVFLPCKEHSFFRMEEAGKVHAFDRKRRRALQKGTVTDLGLSSSGSNQAR